VIEEFNLLDPSVHGQPDTVVGPGGGVNGFCSVATEDGESTGLEIAAAPTLGSNFALEFTAAVFNGDGGYLYATTSDAEGSIRNTALFVKSTDSVDGAGAIFYYRTAASEIQQLAEWDFDDLSDEEDHVIALVVFSNTVELSIDGVTQGLRLLSATVDCCDVDTGANCQTFLLQRPAGFGLDGCVIAAKATVVPPGLALTFEASDDASL